jgi:hypothetical protein
MRRRFSTPRIAVLAACVSVIVACGGPRAQVPGSDSGDSPSGIEFPLRAPLEESEADLPPYPSESDLVRVQVPPTSTASLFIDPGSLTVGDDRVVRLTYVVVSQSGVRNVFFEGIRCDTKQYRTYAWGVGDGPFHPVSAAAWRTIPNTDINNFRKDLRSYYLCGDFSAPRAREEILRYMRTVTPYHD